MDRVQNGTEGPGNSFVNGTILDEVWQQDMQEELINIITSAGLTPTQGIQTQLNDALSLNLTNAIRGHSFSWVYYASGTWVKPSWVKNIIVTCVGGGGGSGYAYAASATLPGASGGAGAGGMQQGYYDASVLGSESVIVGAGGAGGTGAGAVGNPGSQGGTSQFASLLSALGGLGSNAAIQTASDGASGGTSALPGNLGGSAGGGGASAYLDGFNGVTGNGGGSVFGSGGRSKNFGNRAESTAVVVNGGIGAVGSGASGSGSIQSTTGATGGNGTPGAVIILGIG